MPNPVFDVTTPDVQALDDTQARQLVVKLCEAELSAAGHSISGLTAGGAQDTPDGGSDVRVCVAAAHFTPGFVPAPDTVFQVKATPMPASVVRKEMAPKGILRPLLIELKAAEGAYVIACTREDLADPGLASRRKAMADVAPGLTVAFYDASQIALWVNRFAGVSLWMRHLLGRGTVGWAPYGSWSASGRSIDEPYIVDPQARLRRPGQEAIPITDGLNTIRQLLTSPSQSVRLIGLSGHGKTRLAQALFDERLGQDALQPILAIYGDVGRGVEPSPQALLEQLLAKGERAILVVDNCPPEVHRTLVEGVRRPGGRVSILSVEYDVGEDDIEDTVEFRLGAASDEVIEALLKQRDFPLSEVDKKVISRFAGGNARIALAVARTSERAGSLAVLSDAELLTRLFGREHSEPARRAAHAAALVVSFDLGTETDEGLEWRVLADLAGQTGHEFYTALSLLQQGELVQRRGRWRAVLPQALALRLARSVVAQTRGGRLWDALVVNAPQRLRTSFAHRLGQLHDCPEAVVIARGLLGPAGTFHVVARLDELDARAFEYLAPSAPEEALAALEDTTTNDAFSDNSTFDRWVRILRQLAWDAALFERSVEVLFAFSERLGDATGTALRQVDEMFWIVLSGVQAPPAQRFALIRRWIDTGQTARASRAIRAALQSEAFTSSAVFEFGARKRDHGWRPKTLTDLQAWFRDALQLVDSLRAADPRQAATILAARFRELWQRPELHEALLATARATRSSAFDSGLWLAVCETLHFLQADRTSPESAALAAVEVELRPCDAEERFVAHVLTSPWDYHDPSHSDRYASIEVASQQARALGFLDSTDTARLRSHVMQLLATGQTQAFSYGRGVAAAQLDTLTDGYQIVTNLLRDSAVADPSVEVLKGYLVEAEAADPDTVQTWLDEIVTDPVLGRHFVDLQAAVPLNSRALNRLLLSIEHGLAPVWTFIFLSGGRVTDPFDADAMTQLVVRLAVAPGGEGVAIQLLGMRIFSERDRTGSVSEPFIRSARALMEILKLDRSYDAMADFHLGQLADVAFDGSASAGAAEHFARRVKANVLAGRGDAWRQAGAVTALFRKQPEVALGVFLDAGDARRYALTNLLRGLDTGPEETGPQQLGPVSAASAKACLTWVHSDPQNRAPRLAEVIPYAELTESGRLTWTPLARALFEGPNGAEVVGILGVRLSPLMAWGSIAHRLEGRRVLLIDLVNHPIATVAARATAILERLDRQIAEVRASEDDDQAFE